MEPQIADHEIAKQLLELMDKSGFESISPFASPIEKDTPEYIETFLINLRALNAKYDKGEAIQQIRCLMDKYNIQLDQLIDQRGLA